MMKQDKTNFNNVFEQRRDKIKKVPVSKPIPLETSNIPEEIPDIPEEVPDVIPPVRRNILKPANRTALQNGHNHGAVLTGWSVFNIILIASKPGIKDLISIGDSLNASDAILQLSIETNDKTYSAGGYYDKKNEDGIAEYMYIVSPNVSKFKRIFKYNIWICNYHQLFTISKKLNSIEPLMYYSTIVNNSSKNKIGNIPVLDFNTASNWFKSLQSRLQSLTSEQQKKLNIDTKPKHSAVLIPELEYLNKDYNPKENMLQSKIIDITDKTASEYGYKGNFRGTAKLDYDSMGSQILIPLNGTIGVTREDDNSPGTKIPGTFKGKFENGAPNQGVVEYQDGLIVSIKPGDVIIYIENDGRRNFRFKHSSNKSNEIPARYTWEDPEEVIRLIQTDIKAMLDNNPAWVQSFSGTNYINSLKTFNVNGIWDENMKNVTMLLNAQFLGDDVLDLDKSDPKKNHYIFKSFVWTEILEKTKDNIVKYKTEKIPL